MYDSTSMPATAKASYIAFTCISACSVIITMRTECDTVAVCLANAQKLATVQCNMHHALRWPAWFGQRLVYAHASTHMYTYMQYNCTYVRT